MVDEAIRFNGQHPVAPEKVDEMATNVDVYLWRGQAVLPADAEEVTLQIAASSVASSFVSYRQTKDIGLTHGTAKFS
jgi:hypothetical protein